MRQELSEELGERVNNLRNNNQEEQDCKSTPRLSQDDYGTFFEALPVGVYIIHDGSFSYVNPWLSHVLGYENSEQLIGKPFLEVIHPHDRERVKLVMQEGRDQKAPDRGVCRVLKKDGSVIWGSLGGRAMIHDGKQAYAGHVTDVTPLKEMQDSLKKYKTIINEIEDGVGETGINGNLLFINDAGCRLRGCTREEIIGTNYRSYIDVDKKGARFVRNAYNTVYRTGVPGRFIHELVRKDGTRRIVEDSVSLIRNTDGSITGFRTVQRDVTDREEAGKKLIEHRTRLEAIFRSVKDAIITVTPELRVIAANTSTENICGVRVKDIEGKIFPHCFNQCSQACCEVLRQTIEKKTTIKEYHIECNSQVHDRQIVSVSSSPLLDPEGKFMGAVLVIRDVTLLRDLKRELMERHQFQNIIGKSKEMQDLYGLLEDLASLETTVLVTGESGTGKEVIAKALHYSGRRAGKPFIKVSCSALAENLLESELFGHVKGAFTGAINDKQGRFQAADGGTILLDEIGDISPLIQLKLLRVLQDKEFEKVGETITRKVDVRVIACTNKDLKEKVRNGEFREDLYYRLKVVEIPLPPLRKRLKDVPLLVDHFCSIFNKSFPKDIEGVSSDVLTYFMDYPWPGNVRELEHAIECAFVLCHERVITLEHLPPEIRNYKRPTRATVPDIHSDKPEEAQNILDALNKALWNKTRAAHLLGISRQTLYRKIYEYEILKKV